MITVLTVILMLVATICTAAVALAAVWVLRHRKVIVPTANQLIKALAMLSMQTRP